MPVRCCLAEAVPSPERSRPSTAPFRRPIDQAKMGAPARIGDRNFQRAPWRLQPNGRNRASAPELLVHKSSGRGEESVSFWENVIWTAKDGVALAGESVTWHKSQDNAQECYHAGEIGDGSRARDRREILGEEPPDEPTCKQYENSLLK